MDDAPNFVTRLMDQLPELVADVTGHELRCECSDCDDVRERAIAAAQRDMDARRGWS